ncbi:MAG TPA: thiamine pyrophosphate-requiring protein [Gemmatimonadales bacterium]|nr:thiamine pyrophosphate-requiring protein [Gemmatimonadales bacterium]
MADTVSDFLLERLKAWGIHRIYGYPGDGINGIMGALNRADGDPEFIQVRHEEMAALMACAHAKFTGEIGVCLATSGPGAIHLLNGLYDARMDHQPVLAIVGQSARPAMGGAYQQEVDLVSLFKDVASEFVQQASVPDQVRHLVDRAVRIALDQRTVTCLILPSDLQDMDAVTEPPRAHGTIHSGLGYTRARIVPRDDDLARAAELLNAGEKVAMLVGQGALGATDEVLETADRLGAGVAKALLGRAVVPDDLPFVTGSIGLIGTMPSWEMMTECDTLLMVGSSFPYSEFLPKEGQARGVQIDLDGRMLSIRYPMEVGLVGDSRDTLRALLPLLRRKEDRSWRERLERSITRWWEVLEARARNPADPINPQWVFWQLSPRLPDGCIITADSGSSADWFARDLKLRRGMMASLSGNLATMGPGVPYAIAAKFAYPDRVVIACVGDGAMQMNGINELITIAKYWMRWADPRLIVLVLNNRDLNQVTWEQRVFEGDPKYEASQDVPDFPYAGYARSLGLDGERVDRPEAVGDAWDRALAADRPFVLEAVTDPSVPPLPPHITLQQARQFAASMVRGDPNAGDVIRRSFRDLVESYLPHGR